MTTHDLLFALLLPVPPWLGFLIYRYRGKVGISYGYFLGGILGVLALPWPQLGKDLPSPHLGGALLGFTLFIAAHREGGKGLRRLVYGVGGASVFVWLTGSRMGLDMRSVLAFWAMALLSGGLWLLLSDLGYRLTQGRWLAVRMPIAGGMAVLGATDVFRNLPLGASPLSWGASLLAGTLLGLVALQQLLWMRKQGIWVEGRGDGFRVALSALEGAKPPEAPSLTYAIEARQPMFLVNEKGMLLETNTSFSRLVGFPRHQIRGYLLQDLFQGRDVPAWEDLQEKLLRDFRGSVQATLVRRDSSFQNVRLEAVAFDRNIALVWIADPAPGTLALRSAQDAALQTPVLGAQEAGRLTESALATILPAVETILQETWNARTRDAAERIGEAAQRLIPEGARPEGPAFPRTQAPEAMEALLPTLQKMLPLSCSAAHRSQDLTLFLKPEALRRIATQVLLHARQALAEGTITLVLAPVALGGRSWAELTVELKGRPAATPWEGDFLGLTWLQDTVREVLGILELDHDRHGFPWPRIFLPCQSREEPASRWLQGRRVWIIDRDPLVRDALCALVARAGGEAQTYPGLRPFLRSTRREALPDILVLERSGQLERFFHRLPLGGPAGPAVLLLGDGHSWTQGAGQGMEYGPGRIILMEKPFPGQSFLQCLLALLHDGPGSPRPNPETPEESPCPPSP